MYTLACKGCNVEHHRREYRKHGGGVHKICPICRKKAYNDRARIRQQMKVNHESLEQRTFEVRKLRTIEAITKEFNAATRINRNRIKTMLTSVKPTKATIKHLAKRQYLQAQWQQGLDELIARAHAGEVVGSLRDYMESRQCLDVL